MAMVMGPANVKEDEAGVAIDIGGAEAAAPVGTAGLLGFALAIMTPLASRPVPDLGSGTLAAVSVAAAESFAVSFGAGAAFSGGSAYFCWRAITAALGEPCSPHLQYIL